MGDYTPTQYYDDLRRSTASKTFRLSSSLNNKLSTTRNGKSNSYASSHQDHKAPPPELNTIHRALFSDRKKSSNAEIGNKPLFTVTMPKKGNINSRQTYN